MRELLTMIAVGAMIVMLGAGIGAMSDALGHSGGLAKDGCHRDKAAGERHWHKPGTKERAGPCIAFEGESVKAVEQTVEVVKEVLPQKCAEWIDWLVDGNGEPKDWWGDERKIKVAVRSLDSIARVCLGREPVRSQ